MNVKKRDTSQKRESILIAAMQAFSDDGYDKTSMDQIAEKAGASKRTVYNHFPSKELLFSAVIDKFAEETKNLKLIRYEVERSLEEQLGDFVEAELSLTNNETWMGFIKVLLTMFIRDPDMARKSMLKHATGEDTLVTWLQAAMDDGKLIIRNVQLAAKVFWSMIGGAFTWPALYQGSIEAKTVKLLKKELIETFLCRYRK